MPTPAESYLLDLGSLLKEGALASRIQYLAVRNANNHDFELGRLTAYYEVLSIMKGQATAFGLPDSAISLEGLDPDRDLLARGSE